MTSARRVAAFAAAAASVLWLTVWFHQHRAHGSTAENEMNVVLGLTWMDSGKLVVVPLALFSGVLVALYSSVREPGRLGRAGFAGCIGALAGLIAGAALQFWGFEWSSYEKSFEEASIAAGGALQAVGTLVLGAALIPLGIAFARGRVLPAWAVPVLPVSALATFWLTPTNIVPGLAWFGLASILMWRARAAR